MCHPNIPWTDILPSVLLGLRTVFKEDLKASPAEMLFGTPLRIPGEFFINQDLAADPEKFIEKYRQYIRTIRPTPTAHHAKNKLFLLKNIYDCSHVFLRVDEVKPPLTPPYSGPHLVKKRIDDRNFVILVDGQEKTISVDRLKPAFIAKTDSLNDQPVTEEDILQPYKQGGMDKPPNTYSMKKVLFSSHGKISPAGGSDCGSTKSVPSAKCGENYKK
ncbi:uncharacterized protein LOC119686557 [Teleopsis dalmanni]|uniref:uncharacterized protein LOC119686557 n=1 Tax=Teleopsis dalmanni TaxID=139649 RepID=UPI0018CF32FD|nr:uncharacterized protein LOC119686557 [Teleopsis dalmanni]